MPGCGCGCRQRYRIIGVTGCGCSNVIGMTGWGAGSIISTTGQRMSDSSPSAVWLFDRGVKQGVN